MAPAKDEVVLGVDLGTTNSAVAVFRDDSVEVLTNDIDKRTTPSCVYVRDSERQVGEAALRLAASFPANTVRNVKSILGRPSVPKGEAPLGPVESRGSSVGKAVTIKIAKTEGHAVFSPEEIAAMLLLELKKAAEQHLQTEVKHAVIAVPSYFNASQRRAVMDAGSLAGLRVSHLLNETTAAAMAYAFDREDEKTVLMVDVGGGGSSAAVVKVALNQVEVVAHSGVRLPGGEDFDGRMMHYLTQCVKRELETEALDPRDSEILRTQWTKAKEKLSRIPQVTINIFLPGVGKEFRCDLKRADFETECAELFKSITDGLLATLKRAKVEPEELGEVLLVGGSSRIPHLRTLVQQVLKEKPLCKAINPDEAVAKGAALMAAKRVQLKREVLSLNTRIKMGNQENSILANTSLPFYVSSVVDTNIKILQEIGAGNAMIQIFSGRLAVARRIGIFPSGLIRINDFKAEEVDFLLDGCLPSSYVQTLLRKMQSHRVEEALESRRVESKNALEDLLRSVRGAEIPDDCFYDGAVRLRDECEEKLQWLNENGGRKLAEFENIRTRFREAIEDLNTKRAAERMRVEARERLSRALETILSDVEVLGDKFDGRVAKLHNRCKDKQNWILNHCDASEEEYNDHLKSISTEADKLREDRNRCASDQRKVECRMAFESRIDEIQQSTGKFQVKQDDALFHSHCDSLKKLCLEASRWLRSNKGSTAEEQALKEQLESFEKNVKEITRKYKYERGKAEERRAEAFKAAEQKILETLQTKVPSESPSKEVTENLLQSCNNLLAWLRENSEASEDCIGKRVATLNTEISTWKRFCDEEYERLDLMTVLDKELRDGMEVFNDDQLVVDMERCCRGKLLDCLPRPSRTHLRDALSAVQGVKLNLRQCQDYKLKEQEAAQSAQAAHRLATDAVRNLVSWLGCTELAPPQSAEHSVNNNEVHAEQTAWSRATWTSAVSPSTPEQAQHQPIECTSAAPDLDHMEVDFGEPMQERVNDQISGLKEEPMVHSEPASDQRQRPGHRQSKEIGGHQSSAHHVDLQSAAEELTRETLEGARAAGSMALMVDRESTADHNDVVSLSLRYVQETGDAVERLLLVRDATNFKGPADEFVRGIWARFENLCNSTKLVWDRCLNYLSARDCGPFGPAFVKLFSEKMGSDRQVVVSTSVPLDRRVALACYERAVSSSSRAEADILENFFSTVDSFRRALPRGCRCELPGRSCSCPFPTYTSSIAFLLENREAMASAPEAVLESVHCGPLEIDFKMSMNNAGFLVCLAAFGEVFSELCPLSNGLLNSALCMGGYWTGLCDLRRLLVSDDFMKRVITAARQVSSSSNVQNLVRMIIEVANTVVTEARKDFKHCHEILQCLVSEDCKPRGYFGNAAHSELLSLRGQHPTAMFDCPEDVLRLMHRRDFRKRYPSLYSALQRALTAPFLPPTGPRSAEQLRKGSQWAAGVPGHQVEARVIVAGRAPVGVPLSFDPGF